MKKIFFEQYPMRDEEIKSYLENGVLVLDTNVLLNLYFYTAETKDKMIGVMEKCQTRLWMPYQVGWEYFNNREDKIEKLRGSCDAISNNIKDAKNRFTDLLNKEYIRHPYIVRKELIDLFKNSIKPVEEKIDQLKKLDPDYAKKDVIWEKLEKLYEGKVGNDYPLKKLIAIYEEGAQRYKYKVPPGYGDLKRKEERGPRHVYGDLILWKMVIDYAKEKNADVVLVTEEKKEDWYVKKRVPRKDLAKEFYDESGGHKVLICDQEEFLYLTDKYLGTGVGDEAIKEIKEVAKEERKREDRLNQRRVQSSALAEVWSKKLDSSIVTSALTGSDLWKRGLLSDQYAKMAESGYAVSPLSTLYDPKTGVLGRETSLEDYLIPNTLDAYSMIIPDTDKLVGGLGYVNVDPLIGNPKDDRKKK
ncbi:MAG: DUF4935 domain-containing protein [Prevotella sp.]|nr:DUF4935 domain-containing protein [Prevotella sp.]